MMIQFQAYGSSAERHPFFWPCCISLGAHLIFLGLVIFSPGWWTSSPSYMPSVIDVQMVDLAQVGASKGTTKEEAAAPAPAPVTEAPKETEAPVSVSQEEPAAKPEVSVAPVQKATKTSLKYKTFKPQKVLRNALKRVERKVDSLPPKPLEDTIKRLREKVAKEGKPGTTGEDVPESGQTGKGFGGRGGQKEIELIDLYRLEIAYAVQKNWAFAEQLGGGKQMVASIVFKVMPDGKLTDIFFTDHSGNAYLDDSAYKAIVKTSPVKPFPAGLNRAYIEMGLRFTPEGVR